MSFDNEKWYYMEDEKDGSTYRYVLGEKGENPLVVFGINPSTATPEKLDQTMIVVKRLVDSENNDYNGYIMLNLYHNEQLIHQDYMLKRVIMHMKRT